MSAGAPATASKYTLCATLPKAKVMVPPGTIFTGDGLKAMLGVAFTVAVMAGGPGVGSVVEPPPHADRSARKVKAYRRDIIESLEKVRCFPPSPYRPDSPGTYSRLTARSPDSKGRKRP